MSGLEINGSLTATGDITIAQVEVLNLSHAEVINVGAAETINIDELDNLNFKYRDVALRILAQVKIAHNISNHELSLKCAEVRLIIDQSK